MKYIITFCLVISFSFGWSQINLIQNPSFEDTIACPNGAGQIWKAKYWQTVSNTPDYFHVCNPNWTQSVPYNYMGFQWPNTGEAYMGTWIYSLSAPWYREIFGQELSSALAVGVKYFVNFKAVAAYNPLVGGTNTACNNLGVILSTFNYFNNAYVTPGWSHVKSDSILSDTVSWMSVRGSFIADSAYTFISIGNFFSNANTDTIHLYTGNSQQAYYYIDDVCLSTDSLYCELFTGLSEDVKKGNVRIFPNPAQRILTIENLPYGTQVIEVVDELGRISLCQQVQNNNRAELNIASLSDGIYFLRIQTKYFNRNYKFIKLNQ